MARVGQQQQQQGGAGVAGVDQQQQQQGGTGPAAPQLSSFLDELQPAGQQGVVWSDQYAKDPEGGWIWGNHPEATAQEMAAMQQTVRANKASFAYSLQELPGYKHKVSIGKYRGAPAYSRPRQYSPVEQEVVEEKAGELRDANMVRRLPLDNPFAARPAIAAKKDAETGEWTQQRFCVNFIPQNKGTDTIPHALPLPESIFRRFGKARFFSKLDMRSGFHQLVLDEDSQLRTAFWWGKELWCYTRLPFGLKNSSAVYQRVMDTVLSDAGLDGFAAAFVDDVIVWAESAEEHVQQVRRVLQALAAVGLKAHPDKSIFMAEGVEYLGHIVCPAGLQPHQARVASFKQLQVPRTKEELSSQLGMLGFYRCYLPGYSSIAEPLRKMRKKDSPPVLVWEEDTRAAYQGLLEGLTQEGLCLCREDPSLPFVLHTDWSTKGLGAILSQVDEQGEQRMVACISRSLNVHEARYPAWKGELLAVVWAMRHFKAYLAGRDFTVVTDHRPLLWLMSTQELAGQQERWVLALQEFSFCVQHRPGATNPADVPSRYPVTSSADPTGARLDEEGSFKRVLPKVVFATEEDRQQAIKEFIEGTSVAPAAPGAAAALLCVREQQPCMPVAWAAAACFSLCCMVSNQPPVAAAVCGQVFGGEELDLGECPRDGAVVASRAQQLAAWAGGLRDAQGLEAGAHLSSFYSAAHSDGVVVVELFGGIGAGLEAVLRNGWVVSRYVYADRAPAVRAVAAHRLSALVAAYPQQLPVSAVQGAMAFWPQDVTQLQHRHVQQLHGLGAHVMLWAGWECQDLSPAGSGKGLQGPRSSTFFALHRVLGMMQQQLGSKLAWVLENTAMNVPWQRSAVVLQDFEWLRQLLGEPLTLDAAQFGSRAHRLRCYWTNLAPVQQLQQLLAAAQRPPGKLVQDILGPGRQCQPVTRSDEPPLYVCNVAGQPRQALPTLVATVGSYAFCKGGAGLVWDQQARAWTEPNMEERERALGYMPGATAARGVSQLVRHQVLGRCMDANVVMAIVAAAGALAAQGGCGHRVECAAATMAAAGWRVAGPDSGLVEGNAWGQLVVVAAAAKQQGDATEVWEDGATLQWLQGGRWQEGVSRREKGRVLQRARLYVWQGGALWRKLPDGSVKVVPKPEAREGVIKGLHEQCGHFGVRRTAHLVAAGHWWRGMHAQVAEVVRCCGVCDRVNASFGSQQPQLQPLPVEPMFYRWGFDLAGEFPVTTRGNKYVLIAVEHFSKHIELIPLRDKTAAETAAAAAQVLCRFGAPAELVTDGGGEWEGEFDHLLTSCFIDHRVTSPFHPQANGLAERVVQICKRGLRKMCESQVSTQWDLQLPWVALGYRCSKQSSTGFSPYELLYARQPVLPSAVREKLAEPLLFEEGPAAQEAAAASILSRAELLKQRIPVAAANLKAAQHRDCRRYEQLRSKGYLPKIAQYLPGDNVYLKRANTGSTLVVKARPLILRVKEVKRSGVVVLIDKAGVEYSQQPSQLAHCHLPDVDDTIDRTLRGEDQQAECVVCGTPDDEQLFMFCDSCNTGWHTYCCTPPLSEVPDGHFLCERCKAAGVSVADLQEAEQQRQVLLQQAGQPDLFPLADKRRRDERAAALHGCYIKKRQGKQWVWGVVVFRGALQRPQYFNVLYADGTVDQALSYRMVTQGKQYKLQKGGVQPPRGVSVPAAGDKG